MQPGFDLLACALGPVLLPAGRAFSFDWVSLAVLAALRFVAVLALQFSRCAIGFIRRPNHLPAVPTCRAIVLR